MYVQSVKKAANLARKVVYYTFLNIRTLVLVLVLFPMQPTRSSEIEGMSITFVIHNIVIRGFVGCDNVTKLRKVILLP